MNFYEVSVIIKCNYQCTHLPLAKIREGLQRLLGPGAGVLINANHLAATTSARRLGEGHSSEQEGDKLLTLLTSNRMARCQVCETCVRER